MSRKSSFSESSTVNFCQVAPPSMVRSTVPRLPLAHAIFSLTALTPRNRPFTPLSCTVHCATATPQKSRQQAASNIQRDFPLDRILPTAFCILFSLRSQRVFFHVVFHRILHETR